MAIKKTRTRKNESVTEVEKSPGAYFINDDKDVEFIPTGSTLLDSILSGGWAIGRTVNLVGDKSSGKCVRQAYILPEKEGLVKIDELGSNKPYDITPFSKKLVTDQHTSDTTSHFYKENVTETIKITTRHGYTLEATGKHKIKVLSRNCQYEMRRFDELEEGDVAVIAPGTMSFGTEVTYDNSEIYADSHQNCSPCTLPTRLDDDLALFLGYMVADGNIYDHIDSLFLANKREFVRTNLDRILPQWGVLFSASSDCINKQQFKVFIHKALGAPKKFTARNKQVPEGILKSPYEVQKAFLRGLIDCDGSLCSNTVEYSTASEVLAKQVHLMLLNIGVISTLSPMHGSTVGDVYYDHTYWYINIYGPMVKEYREKIGSDKFNFDTTKGNHHTSDYNSIPYLLDEMYAWRERVKQSIGWTKNGKTDIGKSFPSQNWAAYRNATYHALEMSRDHFEEFSEYDDASHILEILDTNYHHDPIVKIEHMSASVDVFDVHIPNTHLFWSNGFVSHNTLIAIEACANFESTFGNKGRIWYNEAESAFDLGYAEALGLPGESVYFVNKENGEPKECLVQVKVKEGDESRVINDSNHTIEGLFEHLEKACTYHEKNGIHYGLYIIDSLDAFSDRTEIERDIDQGTYGQNKAKKMSELFRRIVRRLERCGITVLVISQVRDNIGVSFGPTKTRSGGKALDFYASQIVWLAETGKIRKTIGGVERIIGVNVKAQCRKNKVGLPFRECEYPIEFGYGIDDLSSCAQWLVAIKDAHAEATWKFNKAGVNRQITSIKKKSDTEFHSICSEIKAHCLKRWQAIEKDFMPTRKKYHATIVSGDEPIPTKNAAAS